MPYASNRDRVVPALELTRAAWPVAPLNLFLTSGFKPGTFDLRWDDPSILPLNSRWQIMGVNVYRSFDSEYGPFHRLTDFLMGSGFWQDRTDIEVVTEDVTDRFRIFGGASTGFNGLIVTGIDGFASVGRVQERYVFQVLDGPMVRSGTQGEYADSAEDVQVFVGDKLARVTNVDGFSGEVEIDALFYPNVGFQKFDPRVIPSEGVKVTCSYRRMKSLLKTDLMQRVFYRVTTVGLPAGCDPCKCSSFDYVETPLERAAPVSSYEIEKLDWQWREAIRRNRWILEQGGERVRLFLRKNVGLDCPCVGDDYHKQPQNDCLICYGTAIIGGYEGPYEAIIAPDDAERKIAQKDIGRVVEHVYEVWTGPSPLLAQRDFLVKLNGERYSVGAVRFPSSRGMVLQQHFTIGQIDERDIRREVPMGDPMRFVATQFLPVPPEEGGPTPITEKGNIPDERELRGRTVTWENTTYLCPSPSRSSTRSLSPKESSKGT